MTVKVCYHCNSWVTGVYMAYMFYRNCSGKTSQIEWLFESNLRPLCYFKCSTELWLSLDPSNRGSLLTRASWGLLQAEIVTWHPKWAFAKKWSCIQILDMAQQEYKTKEIVFKSFSDVKSSILQHILSNSFCRGTCTLSFLCL